MKKNTYDGLTDKELIEHCEWQTESFSRFDAQAGRELLKRFKKDKE